MGFAPSGDAYERNLWAASAGVALREIPSLEDTAREAGLGGRICFCCVFYFFHIEESDQPFPLPKSTAQFWGFRVVVKGLVKF